MAYVGSLLGLWTFNNTLLDAVANRDFYLSNDDPYTLGPPITGSYLSFNRFNFFQGKYESIYGLELNNSVGYEADLDIYTAGDFTFGFWFKNDNPLGFTRHVVTKILEPKTAPVIAKAEKTSSVDKEHMLRGTFVLVEKASTETTNKMSLLLTTDGISVSHTINSASYLPGLHHFLVAYDASLRKARIDVDGSLGAWQDAPGTLHSDIATLKINDINPNFNDHQYAYSGAIIRDLYFKEEYTDDEEEAIRNYIYGISYVTDADLVDVKFTHFGFNFNQPNTIATNSIVINGSNIYLGRSNGEVLKGEQPIWDNEYTFDTDKKNKSLKTGSVGTVTYNEDGIQIDGGGFVRI